MSPHGRPVKLRLGPLNIYIVFGSKNMKTVFKNSKSLSKDASTLMIFRNSSMSEQDLAIFQDDQSGYGTQSLTNAPNETRVWKRTHDLGATALSSGPSVNILTSRFIEEFVTELDLEPLNEPTTTPLYDFLKKKMFVASTISLVGTEIFSLNPGFVKTYWEFDDAFLMIALGLPKFLASKQNAALDRMLKATNKWIDSAYNNLDPNDEKSDWEKNFGSKYMRKTAQELEIAGMTREGQAIALLPVIWACVSPSYLAIQSQLTTSSINSNAIPCTGWILFEILKHPGLLQRLRDEITPSIQKNESGKTSIDIPSLLANCPLLTSLYLETIRLRTSSTVTRRLTQDLEIDGYLLKKNNHLMASSWIPTHASIWDVPGHPTNEFWPERFIEMPKMKPENPDEKSVYEVAMRPENWFPYGGGHVMCSGRFFAKQEILAAVALMVVKFEFEVGGWVTKEGKGSERGAGCNESLAGSGVLSPDRDLVVSMERVG